MTDIATDGKGGAIVAWHDKRGEDWDIYAQKVDSSGVVLWGPNGVPVCTALVDQAWPKIISDGEGGAIIVWEHIPDGVDIYAQRVDSMGKVLWAGNGVPVVTAPAYQLYPRMISDGASGAIIVWEDERPAGATDIYAQRIDGSGMARWSPNGVVICDAPDRQFDPQLATDGYGGAVITWWDYYRFDVCLQRVDSNGNTLWAENGVRMEALGISRKYPKIASDEAGGGITAWRSQDSSGVLGVYAQKVNQDGQPQWAEHGILVFPEDPEWYPKIISDGRAGAVILTTMRRLRVRRVDQSGQIRWGGLTIGGGTGEQMIADGFKGAIVAWFRRDGDNDNIYANRVDSSGVILWNPVGVTVCSAPYDQAYPVLVSDAEGGAIMAWNDGRDAAMGTVIYAQRVYADGRVVSVEEYTMREDSPAALLLKTHPNPFAGSTSIDYCLHRKCDVQFTFYNLLGQEVRTLIDSEQSAGLHSVIWNARDNSGRKVPSGTYFLRLEAGEQSTTRKLCVVR